MRGAVVERRRADFDIPAALPRVCSHIRGADAGGSAISWGQWWFGARGFEAGAVNWVLDPFLAERFLLPLRLRSATAHVWTHVMICVEANFPPAPAPARVRPRMCERTRGSAAGISKSARLRSATAPRMCERSFSVCVFLLHEVPVQTCTRPLTSDNHVDSSTDYISKA